jgi:hypothetical protein
MSIILPKKMRSQTKKWIREIIKSYELESHHIKILIQAGECLDRLNQARVQIDADGAYFMDRWKCPRPHPGLSAERADRIVFTRLIRELNLEDLPPENRIPGLDYS